MFATTITDGISASGQIGFTSYQRPQHGTVHIFDLKHAAVDASQYVQRMGGYYTLLVFTDFDVKIDINQIKPVEVEQRCGPAGRRCIALRWNGCGTRFSTGAGKTGSAYRCYRYDTRSIGCKKTYRYRIYPMPP